jgi:hypothetical protein
MSLVDFIKKYALDHYEDGGWDIVAECYDDEQIESVLWEHDARTQADALEAFSFVSVYADRQADAMNSAF